MRKNFIEKVDYETKLAKEHQLVDNLKSKVSLENLNYLSKETLKKFETIRIYTQPAAIAIEELDVYLTNTEKILDPKYLIDMFCWYINYTQIKGYYFEGASYKDLHTTLVGEQRSFKIKVSSLELYLSDNTKKVLSMLKMYKCLAIKTNGVGGF